MNGHHIGYARVSTVDQNTVRQLEGVELQKIFTEKASAKDAKRPILQQAIQYLREGDTLHVHTIDRLARNLQDLQEIVKLLNDKGVTVHFHKENLTFAGSESPMQRLMLQMMGAFAEFERSLIKERQMEGIRAARKAGKRFGRAKALSSDQVEVIRKRIKAGEAKKTLALEYGISRQTLYASLGTMKGVYLGG